MNSIRRKCVEDRLNKKISVLREWAQSKVPDQWRQNMRFSVRWLAQWSDDGLGVEAIRNPNLLTPA